MYIFHLPYFKRRYSHKNWRKKKSMWKNGNKKRRRSFADGFKHKYRLNRKRYSHWAIVIFYMMKSCNKSMWLRTSRQTNKQASERMKNARIKKGLNKFNFVFCSHSSHFWAFVLQFNVHAHVCQYWYTYVHVCLFYSILCVCVCEWLMRTKHTNTHCESNSDRRIIHSYHSNQIIQYEKPFFLVPLLSYCCSS